MPAHAGPPPSFTPQIAAAPAAAVWGTEAALPQSPAIAGVSGEGPVFEGAVVVDAGPFRDITTLSSFEQALAHVPGAEDVYVRSFEGDRPSSTCACKAPCRSSMS